MYIGVPFLVVVGVAYLVYRLYFRKPATTKESPVLKESTVLGCGCKRRFELEYDDAVEEYREMKEREHVARERASAFNTILQIKPILFVMPRFDGSRDACSRPPQVRI
jgi:hypothetical protein